jgi:hypothetical protein
LIQYKVKHHQLLKSVLDNFNADFFYQNNIFFGGGTRIALEIKEYRESVDVDFLCPNRESYRAVREQVTSDSLGSLVKEDFKYLREISFNRDGVRTFVQVKDAKIKIELVSFDNYDLSSDNGSLFPLPYIDRVSCFYTKLLANSDRCLCPPYKDIFDLLAMSDDWNGIPDEAIVRAEKHYGNAILKDLHRSLHDIKINRKKYIATADSMLIDREYSEYLIDKVAPALMKKHFS